MLVMSFGARLLVGALMGNNSNASLPELSLIRVLSELITVSVLFPNGFPCHDGLSSISGKNLPFKY